MDRPQRNPYEGGSTMAMPEPLGQIQGKSEGISPSRRKELLELVSRISDLFDEYRVRGYEKCYLGRVCQVILEFNN